METNSKMCSRYLFTVVSMCVFIIFPIDIKSKFVGSKGTQFLFALMEQDIAGPTTIQISSDVTTRVTLEIPFIGQSTTYRVEVGTTNIQVQSDLRARGTEVSFKAMRLNADLPVSVYVIDDVSPNMGAYNVLPIDALATEYIVASFTSDTRSEFIVTSVAESTKVSLRLRTLGNVTRYGVTYYNDDVIHETLDKFQTLQIQSLSDLTGTVISTDGAVAVFSGSACAVMTHTSTSCGYIVEQMIPLTAWENLFIVPLISSSENTIRIVGRDDGTIVTISINERVFTFNVDTSTYTDRVFQVNAAPVVVIESSRPIFVTHITVPSNGASVTGGSEGPSMTTVPAVNQYDSLYMFGINGTKVLDRIVVLVIIPSDAVTGLRINNQSVSSNMTYNLQNISLTNGDAYNTFEIHVARGTNDVILNHTEGVMFGAIVYGSKDRSSFAMPLGIQLQLTAKNKAIRLVNGTATSGRVELYYHGNWGTICSDGFTEREAAVVCRMQGYFFGPATPEVYIDGRYGQGQGAVYIDGLQCDGIEFDIGMCRSRPWGQPICPHSKDVAVKCGTSIRLTGTDDPREGRVEVFYNKQWGTICDDHFGRKEATVVCRSLGYDNAGYFYTGGGVDNVPQWIDDAMCNGTEDDIAQCMTKSWGITDCTHDEDVWVSCYSETPVRLSDGISPAEGRVEVYINQTWHTVCDNMIDEKDATVICNMLGYYREKTDVTVFPGAVFGEGAGSVGIDRLQCTGKETDIAECKSSPWMVNTSCTRAQDVGVRCGSSIRLVNGSSPSTGRLEVFYKGHWGSVCEAGFGVEEAQVVCRILGIPYGNSLNPVKRNATYGKGAGQELIDDINCHGNETDIDMCSSTPWLSGNCVHSNDVGVDCSTPVRLANGTDASKGRVEVFYQGHWGTVCDDMFDVIDAHVICNQLGFKSKSASSRLVHNVSVYGPGSGPITIDDLQCEDTQTDVQFCISSPWLTHDCDHSQDVGIECLQDNDVKARDNVARAGFSSFTSAPVEIPEPQQCEDGWMVYDGKCYLFAHDTLTFYSAEGLCEEHGSRLVHFETRKENDFIRNYMKTLNDLHHWIGLVDEGHEGNWTWTDTNTTTTFTDWYPGQPEQGVGANCLAIFGGGYGWKWVDEPCTHAYRPICEKGFVTLRDGVIVG